MIRLPIIYHVQLSKLLNKLFLKVLDIVPDYETIVSCSSIGKRVLYLYPDFMWHQFVQLLKEMKVMSSSLNSDWIIGTNVRKVEGTKVKIMDVTDIVFIFARCN
jgi:hypothetical protein